MAFTDHFLFNTRMINRCFPTISVWQPHPHLKKIVFSIELTSFLWAQRLWKVCRALRMWIFMWLLWFQVIIKPCQWKCKQNRVSGGWGIDIAAHCNQPLLKIHLISCVFFYEMHYSCNKIHRKKQLNCNFWEDSSSKRCHSHYLNQCSRSCLHERGVK